MTPTPCSKFGGCLNRSSVKKAASENFLDTLDLPSGSHNVSRLSTPGRSEDNILAAYSNSNMLSTGTPGRIKKFCKRVRRRSVELFNVGKGAKVEITNPVDHVSDTEETLPQSSSGLKSLFSSYRKPVSSAYKGLKKSVSTPSLLMRRKGSYASDDEDFGKRKLSFSGDFEPESRNSKNGDTTKPIAFDKGFVNDAFVDNVHEDTPVKVQTPVIRKTLYPTVMVRHEKSTKKKSALTSSDVLQNIENTPKIMKPKSHIVQALQRESGGSSGGKQRTLKVSEHIKKLTSFSSRGSFSKRASSKENSTNDSNKENIKTK